MSPVNSLELAVVMPVFNEEVSVGKVIAEWIPHLKKCTANFRIFAINDGSKDGTLQVLNELAHQHAPHLQVVSHANRGHGQSCIAGYRLAFDENAKWILQIDSDGQCDAGYLETFWQQRLSHSLIFGYRYRRDDGFARFVTSRFVSIVSWIACGVWVRDANVPYRLMASEKVRECIDAIPSDFYLANILLSLLLKKRNQIYWVNIHFRDRFGGSPSVRFRSFAQHGKRLFLHLLRIRSKI